jgi:hypothetical protein
MDKISCIYKNLIQKKNCKNRDSVKCEKSLRENGVCYTTSGFIKFVKKNENAL